MNNDFYQVKACQCGDYQISMGFLNLHLSRKKLEKLKAIIDLALRYPNQAGPSIERKASYIKPLN